MYSKFVREQKPYTKEELSEILSPVEKKDVNPLIRRLKEYGILKKTKKGKNQKDLSDLAEEDIEYSEENTGDEESQYFFTFVGIIDIEGIVLLCYPKYMQSKDPSEEEFCQIINVLQNYHKSREQIIRMLNDSIDGTSVNLLAVLLFLIQDYYENGLYSNIKDDYEINGDGEIMWEKTINETFALISNNRPYYINLITKNRIDDEHDYFKRLHRCVLTKASREFEEAQLLSVFQLSEIELSEEEIDDFGETDYILYRIENELNATFFTRKQLVLKALYTYLGQGKSMNDADSLSLLGTKNFNLVWEDVCKNIFENCLGKNKEEFIKLKDLKKLLPSRKLQGSYASEEDKTMFDIIEKPFWTETGQCADKSLEPDLVTIFGDKFIIIDAKYYNAILEKGKKPKHQPGIQDITKQYLYQLAYKDFINKHSLNAKNCFVMPTEKDEVELKGEVEMNMFKNLGLESVQVRFLPAQKAYDHYLSGEPMDITVLQL